MVPFWSSFRAESEYGGGRCLRYFDHKILLFYSEHGFGIFFNPKQVLRRKNFPLGVHHPYTTDMHSSLKIYIFEIFIYLWLYYYKWCHPKLNSSGKGFFCPFCLPGVIQTEEISWEEVLWGFIEQHYSPKLWNKNSSCLHCKGYQDWN